MIEAIFARQILDSRGNPTIEVEVLTEGDGVGRAAVPSGASTGIYEAIELRDGGNHFNGLGVGNAVANVNDTIAPALAGEDAFDQGGIDQLLIDLDGTDNKAKLGANAILGVSMAVARAAADELGLELFRYLGGAHANLLPVPLMNVLNGGAHADNNLDVQEFMIAPHGAASFSEALQMGAETYHALKRKLAEKGLSTAVGDEGGFAPNLDGNVQALALLTEAIKAAGYEPGADISIAMDLAASQFFADGKYTLGDASLDAAGMTALCGSWVDNFPVVSLEDPLDERDFEGWAEFTGALGHKVQIVGDDLFATNPQRLEDGIKAGSANSILVKVNQIGTITEAFAAVRMAKDAGYSTVISHRSGETEDAIIADLSVAWNAGQIKAGAPARSERVAKYNQLLRIEERLDTSARYGSPALRKA